MSAEPHLEDRSSWLRPQWIARAEVSEALRLAVFAAAYALAYHYGMSFSQRCAAPFWFPDSVLLCALLAIPPRRWWLYIAATLPIRLFSDVAREAPLWFLLATTAIDWTKGVLAAGILRRFLPDPTRLETVAHFGAFGLFAVLLVPALGAFAGAAARSVLGYDFWSSWDQWFMGDVLAQLVITPAILYWLLAARYPLPRPEAKRVVEGLALAAGLVLTTHLAANTSEGSADLLQTRFYAPVPFLFWAAIRFGMLGASGAVMVTAIIVTDAALQDRGPFAGLSPQDTAAALQNFLLLRAPPLYLIAVAVDQHRQAERRLRESESRFRDMANTAPVMIWTTGSDKRYDFVNQRWTQLTGRKVEQELGDGWYSGLHPDDVARARAAYASGFDARRPIELEYRLRRQDGEYRWISSHGIPRTGENGAFLGYIGSAMDITDRKRAEEIARALAHSQRLATIGELTALMAHEVRQPLCAILVNADTVKRLLSRPEPPLDEVREIIENIRSDDMRAEEIIRRIRAFARDRAFEPQPLDLNTVVTDVLRLIAGDAGRRGVQIESELTRSMPLTHGDPTQLQQLLVNLIINAMDAMAEVPEPARVVSIVTTIVDDAAVEVAVKDRGSGIAPEQLPRIFKSFFTTRRDGLGLGLSIAQSIAAAHNGKLWANNNADGGATFHFRLPLGN